MCHQAHMFEFMPIPLAFKEILVSGIHLFASVSGCPHLKAPSSGWVDHSRADVVTMGCNFTGEKWHLTCDGTAWVGKTKNCTSSDTGEPRGILTTNTTTPTTSGPLPHIPLLIIN